MISGKTESGFEFSINPEDINDMDFIELLGEVEEDVTKIPKVMKIALGADQRARLYDHIRTESGKVPVEKAVEEFQEILTLANSKN